LFAEALGVTVLFVGAGVLFGWLLWGCASAPVAEVEWLARGPAVCTVVPATAVTPCRLELETDDEHIVAAVRSLTGCVVRTRVLERRPDFGSF